MFFFFRIEIIFLIVGGSDLIWIINGSEILLDIFWVKYKGLILFLFIIFLFIWVFKFIIMFLYVFMVFKIFFVFSYFIFESLFVCFRLICEIFKNVNKLVFVVYWFWIKFVIWLVL